MGQDNVDPADWLDPFKRVLKPSGNIFAFTSYNMLGRWHEVFDPEFDTFEPALSGIRPTLCRRY